MLTYFKKPLKSNKADAPVKKIKKKPLTKRPKGLGFVKELNEKIFSSDYDYGF